jgi:hypothetical protein
MRRVGLLFAIALLAVVPAAWARQSATTAKRTPIGPVVRYAIALEQDALDHHIKSKPLAKKELVAAEAVVKQALALGPPPAAAMSLRQALTFDDAAIGLVLTVNEANVHLDIDRAISRKETALTQLGEPAPVYPPLPKPPPANPPVATPAPNETRLTPAEIERIVKQAREAENAALDDFDHARDRVEGINELTYSIGRLKVALKAAREDSRLKHVADLLAAALYDDERALYEALHPEGKQLHISVDGTLLDAYGDKSTAYYELRSITSAPPPAPPPPPALFKYHFEGLSDQFTTAAPQNATVTETFSGDFCGADPAKGTWSILVLDKPFHSAPVTVKADFSATNPFEANATETEDQNGTVFGTSTSTLQLVRDTSLQMILKVTLTGGDNGLSYGGPTQVTVTAMPAASCP